jgi:hypothetical protein
MTKQQAAQQEQEEKNEKKELQAALKKPARSTGTGRLAGLDAGHTGVQTRR